MGAALTRRSGGGRTTLAAIALLVGLAHRGAGQASRALDGRVTDPRGQGVGNATVQVAGSFWRTETRPDGRFRLAVPVGVWEVRVRRIGFHPVTRSIAVHPDSALDSLHVVLTEAPAELRGVVVHGARDIPLASTITATTVRQVPPLGEPDIFRLLPMLPAVSQPNDMIGRVHLAGGASDEHGVYLDGHPLQSPFHVLSILGAFNVAALDRADVLIHHLPSAVDGRLGGAINLESRRPAARPAREGVLSILSTSLTATQPSVYSGTYALGSGRVTYIDKVLREYARRTGATDDLAAPSFRDGLVKIGRAWTSGWSAEAIGYHSLDYWGSGRAPGYVAPRWGENLLGARASYGDARRGLALRLSTNRAFVKYHQRTDPEAGVVHDGAFDRVDVAQRWTSASAELHQIGRRWRLTGGMTLDARHHAHAWRGSEASRWFNERAPHEYDARSRQTLTGVFAEGALAGGRRLIATAGAHVSLLAGAAYVAPRVLVGTQLSDAVRVELAANRRHQFDAIAGEPVEGTITQPMFLLRRPRIADMAALSAAWRPARDSGARRAGAELSLYARRYRDRTVPLELPNDLPFPAFARVPGHTLGAAASVDVTFASGLIVQGSYTAQAAREHVGGRTRPTAWDAPHNLAVFAGLPLGGGSTLTSGATLRSGAAVTPVAARILIPFGVDQYLPRFIPGEPNSARLPAYRRLDLGFRRAWRARGADWVVSLQALNVLARRNALEYDWDSYFFCVERSCPGTGAARRGLPVIPSIGAEVRW